MLGAVAHSQVVTTDTGPVQGLATATYRSFLGIPYAAPPVGNLRWKAPQPAARWHGVRLALAAGSTCMQTNPQTGLIVGAEDCLFVNVYTPANANPSSKLPVMVWLHGGAMTTGSGSDPQYDASVLTGKANAVIVTLNYRLGALGFLGHPALFGESADAAGNYGLLDVQAALRWVKNNISAFGGDHCKVTLFGGSSGALLVWDNIASPTAAGLFHRAITQSFAPSFVPNILGGTYTPDQAQGIGLATAANAGCVGSDSAALACLRGKTGSQIVTAQGATALTAQFGPVIGGHYLPMLPFQALLTGAYNHVSMINGSNHDEATFIVDAAFDLQGQPLTTASYEAIVTQMFGPAAPAVLAQYPASNYSTPGVAYATLLTDSGFSCTARTVNRTIGNTVSLYAYEFNDPNAPAFIPSFNFPLKAYHGAEIQYIFQSAFAALILTPSQFALSDQMIKYWGKFAATGSPNSSGSPNWQKYNPSSDTYLSFVPGNVHMISDFAVDHKCAFWANFGI